MGEEVGMREAGDGWGQRGKGETSRGGHGAQGLRSANSSTARLHTTVRDHQATVVSHFIVHFHQQCLPRIAMGGAAAALRTVETIPV